MPSDKCIESSVDDTDISQAKERGNRPDDVRAGSFNQAKLLRQKISPYGNHRMDRDTQPKSGNLSSSSSQVCRPEKVARRDQGIRLSAVKQRMLVSRDSSLT